jgi:hypothetical protein
MRKMSWLLAAALLCSPVAARAGQQDFNLVNNSSKIVNNVYVSEHNTSFWGSDILGQNRLASGRVVMIHFNTGQRGCFYDLRVDYVGGGNDVWPDLNLCRIRTITLHTDNYGEVQARPE